MIRRIFIIFILLPLFTSAQDGKFTIKDAEKQFNKGHFETALVAYLQQDSSKFNEKEYLNIGVCYHDIPDQRTKGIPYLQKFFTYNDTLPVSHYFIGDMFLENYEFDSAIVHYSRFKELIHTDFTLGRIPEDIYSMLDQTANNKIKNSNFGKVMVEHPRKVIIENLGDSVNSTYDEYAPVISDDEKLLFYTSRRPEFNKISPDGDYFENIYFSQLLEGSLFDQKMIDQLKSKGGFFSLQTPLIYSKSIRLSSPINSGTHDAAVLYRQDKKTLYLFRDNHLWETSYNDSSFSTPYQIEDNVNEGTYVPSIVLSTDGQMKFVSAEKDSGYGGLDIYFSELLPDSTWSEFKNLGETVNTKSDDDVNYFDSNRNTLYFSSKGHSGMGEYDVFKATLKNGEWTAPMNMGYPVNTPRNDVFFVMTSRYNRGYYASERKEGKGGLDLYRLTFADERSSLAEIKGLVLKFDSLVPAYSHITILEDEKPIMEQFSDSLNGDYFLLLAHDRNYEMKVETEGFYPYRAKLRIPKQLDYFQLYQEIHHVYIYDNDGNVIGQQISMHNAFFNRENSFDKDSLDKLFATGKDTAGYEKISNVNFYISEDSLATLIRESDPDLVFDIPDNATIQFANAVNEEGEVVFVPIQNKNLLKKTPIIANEIKDKDSLINSIENTAIDSIPEIVVYFDYRSSKIRSNENLDFFAKYLIRNPSASISITGHTDAIGTTDDNVKLGLTRAQSTKQYLIKKGVKPDQIKGTFSKGESEPIAPNSLSNGEDNPDGRKLNRRVVFEISTK